MLFRSVLPMLATLQGFPAGKSLMDKFPGLTAYVARLSERPSFKNTAPPPRK